MLDSVNNRSSKQSILIYLKIYILFLPVSESCLDRYANKSGWKETKDIEKKIGELD